MIIALSGEKNVVNIFAVSIFFSSKAKKEKVEGNITKGDGFQKGGALIVKAGNLTLFIYTYLRGLCHRIAKAHIIDSSSSYTSNLTVWSDTKKWLNETIIHFLALLYCVSRATVVAQASVIRLSVNSDFSEAAAKFYVKLHIHHICRRVFSFFYFFKIFKYLRFFLFVNMLPCGSKISQRYSSYSFYPVWNKLYDK